jgi:hypothetical protein
MSVVSMRAEKTYKYVTQKKKKKSRRWNPFGQKCGGMGGATTRRERVAKGGAKN